jgi:hypothetical protein
MMFKGIGDRRGLVFAGLVAVLAVVGVYLTMGPGPEGSPSATEQANVDRTAEPEPEVVAPTPVATASDAPFEIYSFLPMSKEELAASADVATRFTAAYGTYRFDEDPGLYADRLAVFTTAELATVLARSVTAPTVVEQNKAEELVAKGSARVKEIREIDRTSVTFVVTGVRQETTNNGSSEASRDYAVTLTQIGSDWRVYDVQEADAGQEGDPATGLEGVR